LLIVVDVDPIARLLIDWTSGRVVKALDSGKMIIYLKFLVSKEARVRTPWSSTVVGYFDVILMYISWQTRGRSDTHLLGFAN
jgi:hypothetical protein